MTDSQSDRLKIFREHLNLSQRDAQAESKILQKSISLMEQGIAKPSPKYLEWLFKKGMNMNWFFSGEGSMFRKKKSANSIEELSGLIPSSPKEIKHHLDIINSELDLKQKELRTLFKIQSDLISQLNIPTKKNKKS